MTNLLIDKVLIEWSAKIVRQLNANYVLDSSKISYTQEYSDDKTIVRVHRNTKNDLILESRIKGCMYAIAYLIKQDFSELENLLKK